ncbi:MAG: DUF2167 domain-containing protein [Candidatus Pseudobacter hemicellulosilyticus]|uniref:DUF2167 domain-containing protein n=1 Tax=Candidatus Pseudobacter hemicellulosilyticus TaxID=3121375 RepID=A0AAJ6BG57_9BACT|nr:MAG: DUF2167 domain-containing protein [Pseudobacter sp.]
MKKFFLAVLALLPAYWLMAGEKDSLEIAEAKIARYVDSVTKAMRYETGIVKLSNGIAQLNVPAGFKFLNAEQSKFILTELWGNPSREDILGMIWPANADPFKEDSNYAFIVTYDEMGYVKDEDADDINYDDMLKEEQKEEPEINKERVKLGYSSLHFVGWAQKPFYDKSHKVLHWAKELKFGDAEDGNTLNYDVRILGRKGVLSLNAVAAIADLPLVKGDIDAVLKMASFTEGNTYKDFDPSVDKVAAWTIGGLVAGKVLAKVGILAVAGKFLAASWKFILLGIVALGGFLKKFFGRKKAEEEYQYQPATSPVEEATAPAEDNAADKDEQNQPPVG